MFITLVHGFKLQTMKFQLLAKNQTITSPSQIDENTHNKIDCGALCTRNPVCAGFGFRGGAEAQAWGSCALALMEILYENVSGVQKGHDIYQRKGKYFTASSRNAFFLHMYCFNEPICHGNHLSSMTATISSV